MSSVGFLEASGFGPGQRLLLFYLVCVPLRLSLPYAAHRFRRSGVTSTALILAGFISFLVNLDKVRVSGGSPWWSRRAHIVSSVLLVAASLLSRVDVHLQALPSLVLLVDVLFGVGSSIVARPFGRPFRTK
jgi:hypothetical protein